MFKIILTIGGIQALAIAVNFLKTKLVAILLGPEGVGVISTIDQVVQSAAYFSALSLPFASIKFLSRAHSENAESFKASYSSFLKALLILSFLGTILTICLAFFSSNVFGEHVSKYEGLLMLALCGIPAMILSGFFSNVFAAMQKFKASSGLAVATNAVTLLAICGGIYFGGIAGLYAGSLVAGILIIGGVLLYLQRNYGLPLFDRTASIANELKRRPGIISFSLITYIATFTYSFSFLVARYSVLKNFGEAQAGLLQGAIAIAIAMGMVLSPTNGLYLTPIMNRGIGNEIKFKTATEFQKKLIVIMCVAAFPAVLFPKLVLTILFSTKFTPAAEFVYLFIIWQVLSQLAGVNQALMIGLDDLKIYAVVTCLGFLSLAFFSWLLVPQSGIFGVAIGFIISSGVILFLSTVRLAYKYGFSVPLNLVLITGYGLAVLLIAGFTVQQYEEWETLIALAKIAFYVYLSEASFSF